MFGFTEPATRQGGFTSSIGRYMYSTSDSRSEYVTVSLPDAEHWICYCSRTQRRCLQMHGLTTLVAILGQFYAPTLSGLQQTPLATFCHTSTVSLPPSPTFESSI